MKLSLDDAVDYALCTHEALRRLGFPAKDIYVSLPKDRDSTDFSLMVMLKTQGQQWSYLIGIVNARVREFEATWPLAVDKHNATAGAVIGLPKSGGAWDRWLAMNDNTGMIASILAKGITLPKQESIVTDFDQ